MSESNNNNQFPTTEAAAKEADLPAEYECEFIVHTKHTCDGCLQQPIIGRRYTSSVHSNFDMCARCFDAYSGPEIGLSEAVLGKSAKCIFSIVWLVESNHIPLFGCICICSP
mmetsp:Transcript_3267/g.6276  ORF Transcript_3267/g.6276 Transcript_3267/m.6276 type:complete len:112 (-) Transcript_3267:2603-2938(-)